MKKTLQITSGRGPTECCWVVYQVFEKLQEDANGKGIKVFLLDKVDGDEKRTLVSATISLEGEKKVIVEFCKSWVGTIQWIGKSQFRKYHKRKNWFVGVNELEKSSDFQEVNDSEIRFVATRSGGPGGQHVNKVSTAVRAVHVPTGISVLASDNRSQMQNKKNARERLIGLLSAKHADGHKESVKANWHNHNELQRGNPVRTFRGTDFSL